MTDLSGLSDAQLMGMLQQPQAAAPSLSSMSDADLLAALHGPSAMDTGTDVAKSGSIGLVKGAIGLAGSVGDARSMMHGLGTWVGDKLGLPAGGDVNAPPMGLPDISPPTSAGITSKVEGVTGKLYEPQTTAGRYAQTVGEFAPAALAGPGGLGRRLMTQAAIPGVASEAAGQATQGTAAEPYARFGAALASPALLTGARRIATPLPANAVRNAMADTLAQEGVPLSAGQRTGSGALKYMESALGDAPGAGGQASNLIERQGEAFTAATLRRAGEVAPRATPEVVDRAFTRIGHSFDDLAARNTLTADRRLGADLNTTELEYNRMVPPNARAPVVGEMIRDIGDVAAQNGGTLPGAQYQAFRSRLDRAGRGTRADPQLSGALFDIRNALDDAMQRSITPADRGAWREVRRQYRNMLVIEKATTGATEASAQGIITPAALRNATVAQGRRAYARGQGDFADLARAGEGMMKSMPQSGTAPRAFATAIPTIAGAAMGGVPGALAGAAAATAGPGIAGRLLMSRPVQAYLGNQAFQPLDPGLAHLRRLLLSGPASLQLRQPMPAQIDQSRQ